MMFGILHRYINKTIIMSTLVCTLLISSIVFLMTMLVEMKTIGEGDYTTTQAFFYAVLRLPNELYQFSPMIVLLGSITGLSILSSHKELAIMRTAGFSVKQIIFSSLCAALTMVFLMGAIGEWIAPDLSYKAEVAKENAKNAGQAVITSTGVWLHVNNNFIHIQHVVGRNLLEGVTRFEFDTQNHLIATYYANKLALKNNKWQVFNGVKTLFKNDQTVSEKFPHDEWNLKFNPNLLTVGLVEPSEMSLSKLSKFAGFLKQNGLQAVEYQYQFWQRIFQPIASLIMIFLSIPFVLSSLKMHGMGVRIMMGLFMGFIFFMLNALLGQLCIVYQLPAVMAASLPIFLFSLIGFLLSNHLIKR